MRLAAPIPGELPLWPPVLATRGPGRRSDLHAHHALHLVVAVSGSLAARAGGRAPWRRGAGVLTAPDVPHQIDAEGAEVLLVFLDPESLAGATLAGSVEGPLRVLSGAERDAVVAGGDPLAIMRSADWAERTVSALGGRPAARAVHPRVRRLLRLLRELPADADAALPALAARVGLSPGRLMHAFTESIGIPLRPYLAWLRLQRAAAGIVAGRPLAEVAAAAGFADAAHMSRSFRRMFGMPPSQLRT
jgi:AraC-like DNA-binding protein